MERQLTTGAIQKDLDNNLNFSPDGKWIVFDCREGETGIPQNTRLGMVNVESGEMRLFYSQKPPSRGVGAASFLSNREVIVIHSLTSGIPYDFTARGGMIVPTDGTSQPRWLDSRDVVAPFTPGALRGGTHKHEPDASGKWVGFTYNDEIMKRRGSDLRNAGVSLRGKTVRVHSNPDGGNFEGESFSVLLTACVDHLRPGSDEYQRADGDCWIGREGYLRPGGGRKRARAFRGTVAVEENGKTAFYMDVFLVDVPDDITVPGPLGPLEGTETDYPKPPKGAEVRRLTHTAANRDPQLRGVSGFLRASGNGEWIVFVGKSLEGGVVSDQLFVVSPTTGRVRQVSHLPGGVVDHPRYSPDSLFVAVATFDGSIWTWSTVESTWGHAVQRTLSNKFPATHLVISPDARTIAFNRSIEGVLQIVTAGIK